MLTHYRHLANQLRTRFRRQAYTTVTLSMFLTPAAFANTVGTESQNFNPTVGQTDFVTVQSARTLKPMNFHLGLFTNHAINTLPYRDGENASRGNPNDSVTGVDLTFGFGILDRLEIGFGIPFVAQQTVSDEDTHGEFFEMGNTEVKTVAKIKLIGGSGFGLATVLGVNFDRTDDQPTTGTSEALTYSGELAADYRRSRWHHAFNIGYRYREESEPIANSLIDPISQQAISSAATSYRFRGTKTRLLGEIFGSQVLGDVGNQTDRELASLEALVGVKQTFARQWDVDLGAGSELIHGLATPDWRIYAGINTVFGPERDRRRFSKKKKRRRPAPEPIPEPEVMQVADEGVEEVEEPTNYGQTGVPTETPDEVIVLKHINFEFDSDFRVIQGAFDELRRVSEQVQSEPYAVVVVEGHTDWMGSDEYNLDLSYRRAHSVRRHLIKYGGLNPEKIRAAGFGESRPVATNKTARGRLSNRRVEIKIYRDGVVTGE